MIYNVHNKQQPSTHNNTQRPGTQQGTGMACTARPWSTSMPPVLWWMARFPFENIRYEANGNINKLNYYVNSKTQTAFMKCYSITFLVCISWCTWSWSTPLDKRSTRSWGCTHSKVLFLVGLFLFFCAALCPFIDEASIKKVIFRGRCVSSLFLLGQ